MEKIIFTKAKGRLSIDIPETHAGELYIICPICSTSRKNEHLHEKKFAINYDFNKKGIQWAWRCNHCGEAGYGIDKSQLIKSKIKYIENIPNAMSISSSIVKWFWEERKIGIDTLNHFEIKESKETVYINKAPDDHKDQIGQNITKPCINYPYIFNGNLVNIKYRDRWKNFKLIKGASKIFYNIDSIKDSKTCYIVEGENDVLAYHESGITTIISVPNGTTISDKERLQYVQTGKITVTSKINLEYLDICIDSLKHIELFILATDDDAAGIKLREELARRLGKSKCKYIQFSHWKKADDSSCKDANDVLFYHGKNELKESIMYAESFPIEGIIRVNDCLPELELNYDKGVQKGIPTGYKCMENHFNWIPGWLITGNGFPGSGKSFMWFNLMCIAAIKYQWKMGLYCPENYPPSNIITSMVEMIIGDTSDITAKERMNKTTYMKVIEFLNNHFYFVNTEKRQTPADMREKCKDLIERHGINMFITDPWKNLKHDRSGNSYDSYLEDELAEEVNFTIQNNIIKINSHHPPTPIRDKSKEYKAPSPFELVGGQIWFASSYGMICCHRQEERSYSNTITEIHIQKMKDHKRGGIPTIKDNPILLDFKRKSGRLCEINNETGEYDIYPIDWNKEECKQVILEGF